MEHGTASQSDAGGSSYSIEPVDSSHLVYPGPGGTVFSKHVDHPGIKPRRFITKVLPDIRQSTSKRVTEALSGGALDDPALLRTAVFKAVEDAKVLIVQSLAENVPGTRPLNTEFPKQSGKLQGSTAASVFEEQSTVVDTSEG